jgi:N utilization substance protein A
VDLGKCEGFFPKKYQSDREIYHQGDRIKALIVEVNKTPMGLQIVLSLTHTEFVRKIFEIEVPEVYDKVVEIHKIVREPGQRTKLAVFTRKEGIDPVGACVGLRGQRIQAVIRELEGEKIDVVPYSPNPLEFIKNALLPASVRDVVILDETKHQALAVVADTQLSLAIGKAGINVRLANRLCDWSIDVKTEAQFEAMDIHTEARKQAAELFSGTGEEEETEINRVSELPGVDLSLAASLQNAGIDLIADYLSADPEKIAALPDVTSEQLKTLQALIDEYVEVVDEDEAEKAEEEQAEAAPETPIEKAEKALEAEDKAIADEEDELVCPECGAKITLDMTHCPNCGVELSFEYEE